MGSLQWKRNVGSVIAVVTLATTGGQTNVIGNLTKIRTRAPRAVQTRCATTCPPLVQQSLAQCSSIVYC